MQMCPPRENSLSCPFMYILYFSVYMFILERKLKNGLEGALVGKRENISFKAIIIVWVRPKIRQRERREKEWSQKDLSIKSVGSYGKRGVVVKMRSRFWIGQLSRWHVPVLRERTGGIGGMQVPGNDQFCFEHSFPPFLFQIPWSSILTTPLLLPLPFVVTWWNANPC